MAQPSLSRRIAGLEAELGTPLFIRGGREVRITTAGMAFVDRARRALAEMDAARLEAERASRRWSGSLRLGFTGSAMLEVLPGVLRQFARAHPRLRLEVHEASSWLSAQALVSGALDVTITRGPPRCPGAAALVCAAITTEALVVAVPAGHSLAGREEVRAVHLAGEVLITAPPGHELLHLPEELAGTVASASSVHNAHTMLELVACGAGIGLGPASMITAGRRDVVLCRLSPQVLLPAMVMAVRRGPLDDAVAAFLGVAAVVFPPVVSLLTSSMAPARTS